jgi:cytochrome c-type biogenesis protein CcmH
VSCLWWLSSPAHSQSRSVRAAELETRLFAPCCYIQTLDVHESELADKLRAEVERRLSAGETDTAIEDDLVQRFGERMRAVPREHDARWHIPLFVGLALSIGLIIVAAFALRWRRRQARDMERVLPNELDASYDAALDDALRRADNDELPPLSA